MNDDRNQHLESIDQPTVHHEETDVNIRAIFAFGGGLFAVTVVVSLAMWALFLYFNSREADRSVPLSPLVTTEERLPPEPRLQIAPREEARQHHAEEDAILNGYTWVDREAGIVRIPIAEAMKLTVQNGLPVREPAGVSKK
jgi:hypothetical protein